MRLLICIYASALICIISGIAACAGPKDLQVSRENFTLLAIDTATRDGQPLARLTWQDGNKMTLTEFKNFPVFEKIGTYYEVRIVRNFFK